MASQLNAPARLQPQEFDEVTLLPKSYTRPSPYFSENSLQPQKLTTLNQISLHLPFLPRFSSIRTAVVLTALFFISIIGLLQVVQQCSLTISHRDTFSKNIELLKQGVIQQGSVSITKEDIPRKHIQVKKTMRIPTKKSYIRKVSAQEKYRGVQIQTISNIQQKAATVQAENNEEIRQNQGLPVEYFPPKTPQMKDEAIAPAIQNTASPLLPPKQSSNNLQSLQISQIQSTPVVTFDDASPTTPKNQPSPPVNPSDVAYIDKPRQARSSLFPAGSYITPTPFIDNNNNNQEQTVIKPPARVRQHQFNSNSMNEVAGISYQRRDQSALLRILIDEPLNFTSDLSLSQIEYYEQKYQVGSYPQKPFCLVVPTFNNVFNSRHIRNIKSIIMQNYTNFHIVVIDDVSDDGTGEKILQYLKNENFPKERYAVIRNQEKKFAMGSLRMAAKQYCKGEDIFLVVDGDDELLGRQVLKLFNAVFHKDDAWFVYSNFYGSNGEIGYSRPFPSYIKQTNSYRTYPFVTSHLRAFYTQLFVNIAQQDLQDDNGVYFKAANDVAICVPILQMSHRRVTYLPELTYYYNSATGYNNHMIRINEQKNNDHLVRVKPSYAELLQLFSSK